MHHWPLPVGQRGKVLKVTEAQHHACKALNRQAQPEPHNELPPKTAPKVLATAISCCRLVIPSLMMQWHMWLSLFTQVMGSIPALVFSIFGLLSNGGIAFTQKPPCWARVYCCHTCLHIYACSAFKATSLLVAKHHDARSGGTDICCSTKWGGGMSLA